MIQQVGDYGNTSDLVYITERYSVTMKSNPLSGHGWIEHAAKRGYEVVHPQGSRVCFSLKSALQWKSFYLKLHNGELD